MAQKRLFECGCGTKPKDPLPEPTTHRRRRGGLSQAEIRVNQWAAKDQYAKMLKQIGSEFGKVKKPEDYAPIIHQLKTLLKSPLFETLAAWYQGHFKKIIKFLLKKAGQGLNSTPAKFKHEYWTKRKFKWSETAPPLFFTCCGKDVNDGRWVFESTRGRVLCRRHFHDEVGEDREKYARLINQ